MNEQRAAEGSVWEGRQESDHRGQRIPGNALIGQPMISEKKRQLRIHSTNLFKFEKKKHSFGCSCPVKPNIMLLASIPFGNGWQWMPCPHSLEIWTMVAWPQLVKEELSPPFLTAKGVEDVPLGWISKGKKWLLLSFFMCSVILAKKRAFVQHKNKLRQVSWKFTHCRLSCDSRS